MVRKGIPKSSEFNMDFNSFSFSDPTKEVKMKMESRQSARLDNLRFECLMDEHKRRSCHYLVLELIKNGVVLSAGVHDGNGSVLFRLLWKN